MTGNVTLAERWTVSFLYTLIPAPARTSDMFDLCIWNMFGLICTSIAVWLNWLTPRTFWYVQLNLSVWLPGWHFGNAQITGTTWLHTQVPSIHINFEINWLWNLPAYIKWWLISLSLQSCAPNPSWWLLKHSGHKMLTLNLFLCCSIQMRGAGWVERPVSGLSGRSGLFMCMLCITVRSFVELQGRVNVVV